MRLLVAAALVVAIWSPPAAAAAPTRDCGSRIRTDSDARFASRGDTVVGPVAFSQMKRLADRRVLNRFRRAQGGYLVKTPASVRAGKVTTVSIAPRDRDTAALTFVARGFRSLADGVPAVRFKPCRRRVTRFTTFAGGFMLTEPTCLDLVVRVRGRMRPYRRTISFGMGTGRRACA